MSASECTKCSILLISLCWEIALSCKVLERLTTVVDSSVLIFLIFVRSSKSASYRIYFSKPKTAEAAGKM